VEPEFWERRQAEFEKYAGIYAAVAAHWSASQGWLLWWGETQEVVEVSKECKRALNVLARKALVGLPQLAALDVESWRVWIEFMHYCSWPFEVTTIIPGSVQRVWDSIFKDGRTVWNFQDEVAYATDEPDNWQHGLLLKGVFQASALFCLELSARPSSFASGGDGPEGTNSRSPAGHETPRPTASPLAAQRGTVLHWSDLTITFLSDERVSIAFSDAPAEHRNYEEMGFGDGRGGKPRAAWEALRELSGNPTKPLRIDKKRAQEIRALLRQQFLIKSDPLLFKKRLGYVTRFKMCRSRSFDT